jgi:hypothetical protein
MLRCVACERNQHRHVCFMRMLPIHTRNMKKENKQTIDTIRYYKYCTRLCVHMYNTKARHCKAPRTSNFVVQLRTFLSVVLFVTHRSSSAFSFFFSFLLSLSFFPFRLLSPQFFNGTNHVSSPYFARRSHSHGHTVVYYRPVCSTRTCFCLRFCVVDDYVLC